MRIDLAGDRQAPAKARRFLTAALAELPGRTPALRADDVVLVASELVTNSVRAGATVIEVELVVGEEGVELQVSDDASGWPTLRQAATDDLDGRGLQIVEDIADEWHTVSLTPGKRVAVAWRS